MTLEDFTIEDISLIASCDGKNRIQVIIELTKLIPESEDDKKDCLKRTLTKLGKMTDLEFIETDWKALDEETE